MAELMFVVLFNALLRDDRSHRVSFCYRNNTTLHRLLAAQMWDSALTTTTCALAGASVAPALHAQPAARIPVGP